MGSYDTVHTGDRCRQTKALGKGLRNLVVGDHVRLYPAPMDQASFEVYLRGEAAPVADTFQVAMTDGGYLIVRETAIEDWADDPAPDLPLFDSLGRPLDLTTPTAEQDGGNVVPLRPRAAAAADLRALDELAGCEVCAQVRAAGPRAYAEGRDAARRERQERRERQRAERAARRDGAPAD